MTTRRTSLTLYRALLRAASAIQKSEKGGLIFTPARADPSYFSGRVDNYQLSTADTFKWKSYGLNGVSLFNDEPDSDRDSQHNSEDTDPSNPLLEGRYLRKLIQYNFKKHMNISLDPDTQNSTITSNSSETSITQSVTSIDAQLDLGFKALSTLALLIKQSARSSMHVTTSGSRVRVRVIITTFLESQLPSTDEYNYHYRVQVENIGDSEIQLCGKKKEIRMTKDTSDRIPINEQHIHVFLTPSP